MSTTPIKWVTGESITTAKIQNLEYRIGTKGILIVDFDRNSDRLNKTFAEIYNAIKNGIPTYARHIFEDSGYNTDNECFVVLSPILSAYKYDRMYRIMELYFSRVELSGLGVRQYLAQPCIWNYYSTDPNGYPVFFRMIIVDADKVIDTTNY